MALIRNCLGFTRPCDAIRCTRYILLGAGIAPEKIAEKVKLARDTNGRSPWRKPRQQKRQTR